MKVLHISSEPDWRGGEQQLAYLVDELLKHSVEQWILCLNGSALHTYCNDNNLQYFTYKKGVLHQLRVAKQVKNICREFRIGLLHVHDSHAHNFAVLAADMYANPTPIILSRKVMFATSTNFLSHYKYNHKNIRKIICVSMAVKKVLQTTIRHKNKLCIVYDCIDLQKFTSVRSGVLRSRYNIPADELIIGNIAALTAEKGHITFINTAELLIRKGIKARFIIIGDGKEKQELMKRTELKKINDKIIFHGFAENISILINDFDVFLFTSEKEGLGSILLASFAVKVPVVATDAGGIPELVKQHQTGLIAKVGDETALAENIISLINSSSLKDKLVCNAHDLVQKFSKQNICKQTLEIYEEVVKERD